MLEVQEILSMVGSQGEDTYGLGGFSSSTNIILAAIEVRDNYLRII